MRAHRTHGFYLLNTCFIVILNEIIAESLGRGVNTKGVMAEYESIVNKLNIKAINTRHVANFLKKRYI